MKFSRERSLVVMEEAKRLHAKGMTWEAIAERFDVSRRWLQQWRNKTAKPSWATAAELRFHTMRLGNRDNVAKLYGVSQGAVYAALPIENVDLYNRGMMVNIGGILARKCTRCGVARQLDDFWSNASSQSGCRETCSSCRTR